MAIYTQAELNDLTAEEYANFLVEGILVDPEVPFYWEQLATYTPYAELV
jgi:hypothetical protein